MWQTCIVNAKKSKKKTVKNPAPGRKAGITPRQSRFVELLVVEGKTGAEAARLAGFSEKTAATKAHELIHKNKFTMAAIEEKRAALSMRSLATRDRWEEEVCRLAFFDPSQFFEDDGSPKRIQDIPEDARRALAGLEVLELFEGQGDQKHAIGLLRKFRLPNKKDALELLAKANGWVIERKSLEGPNGGPLQHQVTNMSDDDLTRVIKEWSK